MKNNNIYKRLFENEKEAKKYTEDSFSFLWYFFENVKNVVKLYLMEMKQIVILRNY